eukprot:augustus_masked-scaffold_78-processed-gene-0.9-mRNA-1 protein AED:1.00 eAED:1.00 QI:0/-1/0/0/-1/1/1/0/230
MEVYFIGNPGVGRKCLFEKLQGIKPSYHQPGQSDLLETVAVKLGIPGEDNSCDIMLVRPVFDLDEIGHVFKEDYRFTEVNNELIDIAAPLVDADFDNASEAAMFVMCYDVEKKRTLDALFYFWIPLLKNFVDDPKLFFLGLKEDLLQMTCTVDSDDQITSYSFDKIRAHDGYVGHVLASSFAKNGLSKFQILASDFLLSKPKEEEEDMSERNTWGTRSRSRKRLLPCSVQ